MVSSNINNISVITHYNYHSLMDHIGSGKDWTSRAVRRCEDSAALYHGVCQQHEFALPDKA